MKKILNLILVRRDGIEKKWWHRLANVLIFGSTILLFIGTFLYLWDSLDSFKNYSYTAYNFENGYTEAKGNEIECRFHLGDSPITSNVGDKPYVVCGEDYSTDIGQFLKKYNDAFRQKFSINDDYCDIKGRDLFGKLTNEAIKCFREKNDISPLSMGSSNDKQKQWEEFDFSTNIKVKRESKINFGAISVFVGTLLLVTIGWFIVWEAIIYRALVYIIFGSKKYEVSK